MTRRRKDPLRPLRNAAEILAGHEGFALAVAPVGVVRACGLGVVRAANNAKPPRLERAGRDDAGRGPRLPDAALQDRPAARPPDDRITG